MGAIIPAPATIPYSGQEAASTLATQDANNGKPGPLVVLISPASSGTVEPARASVYPRGAAGAESVQHRTAITSADTADPSAVPAWVGRVAVAASSGATTLHVVPYGDYGTPPISTAYQMVSGGTTWDTTTPTAVSGGSGSDYALTVPALAHAHAVGDLVVCVASGGSGTTGGGAGSVPSGAVGGRGASLVAFRWALAYGSATATATVTVRVWDTALARFIDVASDQLSISAAGTVTHEIRVDAQGEWYYLAVTGLSGTGASVQASAVVWD